MVLRILLNEPEGRLPKYTIAKKAGGTYHYVYEVLSELERDGYIAKNRVIDAS